MKNKYIFIALLIFCQINLFAQDFQWARQIKGVGSDYNDFVNGLAVDSNENTYTIGNTESLLFDLDPTVSGIELVDNTLINHTFRGTYLIKTDVDGNYKWGMTFGSYKGGDQGVDVKIGTDGNVYALLSLEQMNTSLNIIEAFIKVFKISPTGNILSTTIITQSYGFGNNMYVDTFDLDSQNNIYLSGYYTGSLNVNNNPNLNLNSSGIGNYLLKINSNGSLDWVKQFNINDISENKVIVRPDGNINLILRNQTGYILYNIDSTNNSIIWQKDFINQSQVTFHVSNSGIVILGNKDYFNTIDVDPSAAVNAISGNCVFIIFLNLDGTFLDVKQFYKPTTSDMSFSALTTDVLGNYYFSGNFGDTVDFDSSVNTFNLSSPGSEAFYLKLDSNRNFESVIRIGLQNPIINNNYPCSEFYIKKIKIVNDNNYLAGEFQWLCDFNPSATALYTLNTLNNSTINKDGFILKLSPCNSSMPIGNATQTFCSSQNPTVGNLLPNSTAIKWYDSAISTNQLSSTKPLVNGQTYYAAKQTGTCPESQRLAVTATINQSPASPIAANQTFCESENATIASLVVTGQDVKWYSSITDTNTLPITTLLQNNTNYYATQTVNGCESGRTLITVTVNSVTSPIITSPQTFCIQQNALLSSIAITGQNVKWYNSVIGGSLLLNSTSLVDGQTYYASQTVNNCESLRVSVLINIQNTSSPTGSATQTFCSTQNPTLNDVVVNGANLNWYTSLSSVNAIPSATLLVNGSTYYVTQTINYCESVSRLAVTVTLINTLSANDYLKNVCDDLNDGSEIIDLTNYNANLISNVANCTFDYYTSLIGATNQINSDLISTITNYHLTFGNPDVFVRITSINGCHQIVKLNLTLVNTPVISIADIVPICEKNSVTINAGSGFDSYTWSTGATSQTITTLQAGNYAVTVTKNYGTTTCSSTKNFTVVLSNSATITGIDTQDWTDTDNVITVNLSASSIGNYEYSIDGINYQVSANFYGLDSGYYTVYIRDKNGCGVAKEEVFLLMYPKFFTPNSDGYNDTWAIRFSRYEPKLKVVIYDRYGKPLKSLKNSSSWDGKYDGNELPADDYWFVVTRENGKEYKGHFTLKR